MTDATQVHATITAHFAGVAAADAAAVARCYAQAPTVFDPVGGEPVQGRAAIERHFERFLTEPRGVELLLVAVVGAHAAVHFSATPAGGLTRNVIDVMTFDEDSLITSMEVYAPLC